MGEFYAFTDVEGVEIYLETMQTTMKRIFYLLMLASVYFYSCEVQDKKTKEEVVALNYPESKKVDTFNIYFGDTLTDPYRWLENDTSAQTAE